MSWNKNTVNCSGLDAIREALLGLGASHTITSIGEFVGRGLNDEDGELYDLRRLQYFNAVVLEYVDLHSDCDADDVICSQWFSMENEPKDWQPIRHINDDAGVEQASREFLGLPHGMPLYKSRHLVGEESYKAGQRSVVEWVESQRDAGKTLIQGVGYGVALSDEKWQAQLEEWGI